MAADPDLIAQAQTRIGKVLCAKYRIEAILGVGGMATVYSAVHRNGRRVAVKLLHPELSVHLDIRKRFLREGHAASAVDHPGVVVVIDDDVSEDGAAFLVLELLEGQTIEDLWEQNGRRLPAKTVIAVAREVCDVLAAAHRAGIVHRDIKPANLFITREGRLKVLDFGIARVRDTAASTGTQSGAVFGTPAFMAPEQASGRASLVDERTDVWALGATMFALLTGTTVHVGETGQHLTVLAATQPARSLASVKPDVPPELVSLVDRALAFERDARWSSATAMRAALVDVSRALFGEAEPTLASLSATLRVNADATLPTPRGDRPRGPAADALVVGGTTDPTVLNPVRPSERDTPFMTRAVDSLGALFRFGTAPTVHADAMSTPPRRSSSPLAGVLVALCIALILAAGAVRLLRHSRSPAISDANDASVEDTATTAAPVPSALGTVVNGTEPVPPSLAAGAPSSLSVAAPSGLVRPRPRPAPTVGAGPVNPSPSTRVPSTSKGKCDPPYTVDATGKMVWKEQCL